MLRSQASQQEGQKSKTTLRRDWHKRCTKLSPTTLEECNRVFTGYEFGVRILFLVCRGSCTPSDNRIAAPHRPVVSLNNSWDATMDRYECHQAGRPEYGYDKPQSQGSAHGDSRRVRQGTLTASVARVFVKAIKISTARQGAADLGAF
jgi:hypothetical protein